ncbi:hypothetical protein H9W90_10175 [Polaribacter pectinis]|uniref:Uncharacterized protein n=1 Tax=Polaribacter pectinis TaxID=2738844 RepID=A0A7G9L7G3_9FLAO|nr:hypothetical protein [Polaribacter pectinis]QNM84562.1 hypothetical protein H9W90_10175 [Polaribacter pectinis]
MFGCKPFKSNKPPITKNQTFEIDFNQKNVFAGFVFATNLNDDDLKYSIISQNTNKAVLHINEENDNLFLVDYYPKENKKIDPVIAIVEISDGKETAISIIKIVQN